MLILVGSCILSVYIGGVIVVGSKFLSTTGNITAYEIKKALTWPMKLVE